MRQPLAVLLLAIAVSSHVPSEGASGTPSKKPGEVVIVKAFLTTSETGRLAFELGTLYVPENRADPKSRLIGVGFARFRGLRPTGSPPLSLLPGGPGYSFLMELKQSSKKLASSLRDVLLYRRFGDVVLVDQRGYSQRGDILKFRYRDPGRPLDQPASLASETAAYVGMAKAAVAEFAGSGIDLRGYTVKDCADDVDDLRQAIGYGRIILVGGSFGSQWSFAVMRRHPDIVARALLWGVEPLDSGEVRAASDLDGRHRVVVGRADDGGILHCLVQQILEVRTASLERGRVDVGEVVRDHLGAKLLRHHAGSGGTESGIH